MDWLFKLSTRLLTVLLWVAIAYSIWAVIGRTALFVKYVQHHDQVVQNTRIDYEKTTDAEIKQFKEWAANGRPGIIGYFVTVFFNESVLMGLGASVVCWALRAYCHTKWQIADRAAIGPHRQLVGQPCATCGRPIVDETAATWDLARKAPIHKLCVTERSGNADV